MSAAATILITFAAAIVNGALGYGFSSVTVPLALLFVSNRQLNPALVAIEVALNAYVLWVNRAAVTVVARRLAPVASGLVPGVTAGTLIVAHVSPSWVKLATYVALLPVVLMQVSGFRRPVRAERTAGPIFGAGIGALYSVTTISGPPLAVALNNQGFAAAEFRAAIAFVRLTESTLTAIAYAITGLYARETAALIGPMVPSVLVGVPIGALLVRRIDPETFRRLSMSFDAWVVAFGLSTLLRSLGIVRALWAYAVLAPVIGVDVWLLYRYFFRREVPCAPAS